MDYLFRREPPFVAFHNCRAFNMLYDRRPAPRQAAPEITRENVTATVKWFNAQKGFGFVSPDDGSPDAFLHASVLAASGVDSVNDGDSITCDLARGSKGPQVATIHQITPGSGGGAGGGGFDSRRSREPSGFGSGGGFGGGSSRSLRSGPSRVEGGESADGTVKWYKADRGFGFVSPDGGGKDIFVHASALERSGLDRLDPGQRVRMTVGQGLKGPQADRITLI